MLKYEACVILSTQLTDEGIGERIQKLSTILTEGGARISQTVKWGRRKLAHPIDKATEAFYVLFFFDADVAPGPAFLSFERTCRYDESILRQTIISIPVKKGEKEVTPLVPEPNWLGDFNMKLRPVGARRRFEHRRGPDRHFSDGPPPEAAEAPKGEAGEAPKAEAPKAEAPKPAPAPAPVAPVLPGTAVGDALAAATAAASAAAPSPEAEG